MKNKHKKKIDKSKLARIIITISTIIIVALAIYAVLYYSGVLSKVESPEGVKDIILKGGSFSYIIFVVIQFLQVTFIPIPAMVTTIAGSLVFDPWVTVGLSLIAVISASIFAFWLGKKFGKKIIYWIAGKEDGKKWMDKMANAKYLFFLMMLFPGFPDDILCTVVGATNMTYKFFIITNLITRPIVFIGIVFFAGGHVIPYTGWGIPVWVALGLVVAVLFYLSVKYQKQIEKFILKTSKKLTLRFK